MEVAWVARECNIRQGATVCGGIVVELTKEWNRMLGIGKKLLISFCPQKNGQTE